MTCMFTLILTNKCVNQRSMTVILRSKLLQHNVIVVICEKVTNTSGLGLKQLVFPKVLLKFPLSHNRFSLLLVSKYGGFFGGVTIFLDLNLQPTHPCLANKKNLCMLILVTAQLSVQMILFVLFTLSINFKVRKPQ